MKTFTPKHLSGEYTRSDGSTYTYDVTIDPTAGGSAYFAKVRCDGELRGQPNGSLIAPKFTDPMIESAVRVLVDAAIRDGVGVRVA